MILRRLGAGLVGVAMSLLALPALAAEAAPEPTPYLNGFCLSVVAGASGVEALRERLQAFSARPAPSAASDAARPQGVEVAGQLFRFAETGAPDAFVDQRRGDCALVFSGAVLPGSVKDELLKVKLPVGPEGASVPWRLVTQTFAGRPRPPKYFLQMGDREGFGVCAEINNDLRRRDQSPVAMVQLYNCRIGKDERLGDNG